ncbi:hypothetical protein GCM10011584_13500 [Nocardioides phosphati]|uniref:DUF3616 domain-containing protein n=1 Tax=Nocardioides phosphati TaxID=1867775 RepID=A0ABQ2N9Q0_9ACTN|nr:hypothetical protein [Nocardioides phosphati]GGO87863.1 hypothetical protein GCM10011584_13500 [Nocardioides phosphati]
MIRTEHDEDLVARLVSVREVDGVRAGSALLTVGDRLLVVGDDAHAVTLVDPATGSVHHQALAGDGRRLEKSRKPDYEAAFRDGDDIWLLGSGSLSNRWLGTRLPRAGEGRASAHDLTALYAALSVALGEAPNIEGAVVVDGVLRLCHRATGSSPDVLLDLSARVLHDGRPRVERTVTVEPAVLDGVPAHVTDLAALPDGRLAFLAAAEDTDDPVVDGPVAGAAFGVIDGERARWTPLLGLDGTPSTLKAEGLVVDPDLRGGWAVTDRDDPGLAAQLCRLELTGI